MTLWESLLLGVVQGLFMFIPVSSSSHLVLTQHWMAATGSPVPSPDTPEMILFNLVVHMGTMVSVVVVMHRPLVQLLSGTVRELRLWARRRSLRHMIHLRLMLFGVVTTGVTGVLGLLVREYGTGVFATPWAVSVMLLVTGAILWWTDTVRDTWRGAAQMTIWVALLIGLAQAAALFPGLSRSGLTIAVALALGMHRKIAAQYSFFVAIPTIVAATGLQSLSLLDHRGPLMIGVDAYVVAFLVSALVGAAALWLVLRMLYRGHFRVFAVYVLILAVVTLIVQPESEPEELAGTSGAPEVQEVVQAADSAPVERVKP
ncbi:undecaprenyl-diphosphate phosphatase [Nesterenkonia sp. HG001]|uniref:undecaprenyl-diphosphate phosphatase n=1 Tax=Nesterenkonia sp. HG001 TaxID=2983207 RepID=UPI002AC5067A|nr:undecaprenyl-diphosphate phosphatase [Nesterenkonia sp. HG001]MDZ5076339.1 undecaprenyl-diphosphate phosphatase [Nesterenkonia sp. HG001]